MPVRTQDIQRAVSILQKAGATRVLLFGSAVDHPEKARDLDLACAGLNGSALFGALAELEDGLLLAVDLVPLEPPSRFTRYIERRGRVLFESK